MYMESGGSKSCQMTWRSSSSVVKTAATARRLARRRRERVNEKLSPSCE
jgi:hypothetical protein